MPPSSTQRPFREFLRTYPHGTAGDLQRMRDVMDLVNQGASYEEIASRIGYTTAAGARKAHKRAMSALAPGAVSTRQFGCEFEFLGLNRYDAEAVLRRAGINVAVQDYNHTASREQWKIVGDSSVNGEGNELVSPILSGEDGLRQVQVATDALREAGGQVDTSCGLHVHLDMAGLNFEGIVGFVGFYADRQDAMDMLVAPSRRGNRNGFCAPITKDEVRRIRESLSASDHPNIGRYRKVNIMSYPQYGTVEIRHHQGTLSSAKADAWIRLLLAMVEVGSRRVPAPTSLVGMLHTLHKRGNLDRKSVDFLTARARAFGYGSAVGTVNDPAVDPTDYENVHEEPCNCYPCRFAPSADSSANPF